MADFTAIIDFAFRNLAQTFSIVANYWFFRVAVILAFVGLMFDFLFRKDD